MEFKTIPKFDKEFKKLFKKHKTLDEDIKIFKRLIQSQINQLITKSSNHHAILHANEERTIFILKSRLNCRSLRGSTLRVIYAYSREKCQVTFIELFFKGKKALEDTSRWKQVKITLK